MRGPLDQLTISHAVFGSNHPVSQIVNLASPVARQLVNIASVKGYNTLVTMPKWINGAKSWSGLHISPDNPTAPAAQGAFNLGVTTFAKLPDRCRAGDELYCVDCKSVANGVSMASACEGLGKGSAALCKELHSWKCGQ